MNKSIIKEFIMIFLVITKTLCDIIIIVCGCLHIINVINIINATPLLIMYFYSIIALSILILTKL